MFWNDTVIAIVERDPSLRRALGRLLRSADFFSVAFSTIEALLFSPLRPEVDCLVVNVEAPGLTARDLERRLLAHRWTPPVILLGGAEGASVAQNRRVERPFARLRMPIDARELLCQIRIELAGRDLNDARAGDLHQPGEI